MLEHRQAVEHRQADVEHGDVEGLLVQQVVGHRTVRGMFDLVARALQLRGQGIGKDGVVFGQQQFHD